MKEKRNVWLAIGGLDSENKPTKKYMYHTTTV